MWTFILAILLTIGVSVINGNSCACCFPGQAHVCQTPAIDLPSCDDCTSFFCANHVKGCQGTPPCTVECKSDSTSTSTSATFNRGSTIRFRLFTIFTSLMLVTFVYYSD
jgi:hypothetical protein